MYDKRISEIVIVARAHFKCYKCRSSIRDCNEFYIYFVGERYNVLYCNNCIFTKLIEDYKNLNIYSCLEKIDYCRDYEIAYHCFCCDNSSENAKRITYITTLTFSNKKHVNFCLEPCFLQHIKYIHNLNCNHAAIRFCFDCYILVMDNLHKYTKSLITQKTKDINKLTKLVSDEQTQNLVNEMNSNIRKIRLNTKKEKSIDNEENLPF